MSDIYEETYKVLLKLSSMFIKERDCGGNGEG